MPEPSTPNSAKVLDRSRSLQLLSCNACRGTSESVEGYELQSVERRGDGIGNDRPDGKGHVVGQSQQILQRNAHILSESSLRLNANHAPLLTDFGLSMQAGWADTAEQEWQHARPFAALRVTIGGTAQHLNMEKPQTLRCAQGDKRIVLDFLGAVNQ